MEKNDIVSKILAQLLSGAIEKNHSYCSSLRRIATWNNPLVDYAYQDNETEKTVAIVFPDTVNQETIRSLAIKAITSFDSCIICVPASNIVAADCLVDTLKSERIDTLAIGIIVFDENCNLLILHTYSISKNAAIARSSKEQKSYWCWWRDGSHYEVATLLKLSFSYMNEEGDIYSSYVYPAFFEMMISGRTKMWDGSPRKKSYSVASYKAEKQNYKIPMCQLGLWNVETGQITEKGLRLLDVVNTYGDDSTEYFDALAKLILVDGKHLDLIKDLEDFQKNNKELVPETSSEFFVLFDDYMMRKNSMGTRKPTAVKTGAKKAYVRDEPKLWNKLGIISMHGSQRYYVPFKGIEFNWNRINEILLSNVLGGIHAQV